MSQNKLSSLLNTAFTTLKPDEVLIMGFGTKRQPHDAVVKLDEHERAMARYDNHEGFWLGIAITLGLAVWAWTGYEIYTWWKS